MLRLLGRTAKYGALAGLTLAGSYTLLTLTVMGGLAALGMLGGGKDGMGLLALPVVGGIYFCGWLLAGVLGLLPGALLGALGGAVTGLLLALWPKGFSMRRAALPGICIGLGLAVGLNLLLGPGFLDDYRAGAASLLPYFFWAVGPGLLLPIGLGWAGWKSNSSHFRS
jgi:hypothetical protein